MLRIRICKWDKHNPRKDYKSMPWFKVSSRMYRDPKLKGLSSDAKWLWVCLLCIAAEENKGGVVECEIDWLADESKVAEDAIALALPLLQAKYLIEFNKTGLPNGTLKLPEECRSLEKRREEKRREENTLPAAVPQVQINDLPISDPSMLQKRGRARARATVSNEPTDGSRVWDAYAEAYERRYKQQPVRNKLTNSACKQLVERLGAADAVAVVSFYLTHNKRWYVETVHNLRGCLQDAEGLVTQMRAGYRVSASEAQSLDRQTDLNQTFDRVLARLEEKFNPDGSPK